MIAWIKKKNILLSLLLVLAVMAVIFIFSAQSGPDSDKASGAVIETAQQFLGPAPKTDKGLARTLQDGTYMTAFVRKAAHICEYAALGFALMLHFRVLAAGGKIRRPVPPAFLIGVLYGGTDELHQLAVSGRKGSLSDVLIDSIGVALGLALLLLAVRLGRLRRRRRGDPRSPRP